MRRVAELDGLRGVAVLMVMALHLGLGTTHAYLATAVDLFFVLSGYLITRIMLDHPPSLGFLKAFYARRVLRIWPIYYALLFGFLAANSLLRLRLRTTAWPYYLTFTQFTSQYFFLKLPRFWEALAHTWTLACEEQFYLLWPLVGLVFGRRALLPAACVLIGSAFVCRFVYAPILLATACDGFALGAVLAATLGEPGSARARRPGRVATLALIGVLAAAYPLVAGPVAEAMRQAWPARGEAAARSLDASRIFLLYTSIVGLTVAFAGSKALKLLRHPCLTYVGTISYGLYLFHIPIYVMLSPTRHDRLSFDSMAADALKLAASFAVAILSWHFVERPILGLKDRFRYPTGSPEAVPRPHFRPGRRSDRLAPATVNRTVEDAPCPPPPSP